MNKYENSFNLEENITKNRSEQKFNVSKIKEFWTNNTEIFLSKSSDISFRSGCCKGWKPFRKMIQIPKIWSTPTSLLYLNSLRSLISASEKEFATFCIWPNFPSKPLIHNYNDDQYNGLTIKFFLWNWHIVYISSWWSCTISTERK